MIGTVRGEERLGADEDDVSEMSEAHAAPGTRVFAAVAGVTLVSRDGTTAAAGT